MLSIFSATSQLHSRAVSVSCYCLHYKTHLQKAPVKRKQMGSLNLFRLLFLGSLCNLSHFSAFTLTVFIRRSTPHLISLRYLRQSLSVRLYSPVLLKKFILALHIFTVTVTIKHFVRREVLFIQIH